MRLPPGKLRRHEAATTRCARFRMFRPQGDAGLCRGLPGRCTEGCVRPGESIPGMGSPRRTEAGECSMGVFRDFVFSHQGAGAFRKGEESGVACAPGAPGG